MTDDRYRSPLGSRYASREMQLLWGEPHRIGLWRRVWLALAESEKELGLAIPDAAIAQMQAHLDDADLAKAAEYEKRFRHDVMAHVHHFGDQAPEARPVIHLGATSAFVTDNADLVVMREGLRLVLGRVLAVLDALEGFAAKWRATPCLAYTHFQPAQLTTVGKRATLWMQDLALDVEELVRRLETLRAQGCKGTTGTQASFLDLFAGDHAKVRELERRFTARMGFDAAFAVTGQTYPRKQDSQILDVLSGIAQGCAKMANDLRLLQHENEVLEPFEAEQIGSSAMAYKRNPMRAERINALARFVLGLQTNGAATASAQWLERTLDDSANRRLVLPEAFLAVDAILILAENIARGLEVREEVVQRHVQEQMPFMATERWLMLGVQAGGDRQTLHEVVRKHSLAAAEAAAKGKPNDLLERLGKEAGFKKLDAAKLQAELDPARYVGRSPQQVDEFLGEYLRPLVLKARPHAVQAGVTEIRGMTAMLPVVAESALPLPLLRRGKVREVYEVDADTLLLVASDRVSAFDVVMKEPVPMKGAVLTQISAFWFQKLAGTVDHHMLSADADEIIARIPALVGHRSEVAGRSMLVRRTTPVPFECVVRGYLSGSAWAEYRKSGTLAGEHLAAGLTESARFDPPVFSPATKAETGHDENVTFQRMRTDLGPALAEKLKALSLAVYGAGRDLAATRGIIIADTKFEFGEGNDGGLRLIDEVLTPDSSRFWPADRYAAGGPQPSFDKQPLRDYLSALKRAKTWNGDAPPPALPAEVVARTSARYLEAFRLLTGRALEEML